MRRRHDRWASMLVPFAMLACMDDPVDERSAAYPTAGLYTPGSRLGASDPTDTPNPNAGLGDRCVPLPIGPDAGVPAVGVLKIEYKTQTLEGRFAPKNCTAVWVETFEGAYVATLEVKAKQELHGMVYMLERACSEKPGPDVVTGATIRDHSKSHTVRWSGVDFEGVPAPDGKYKLMIEVTESDKEPGELLEFEFDKTAAPFEREIGVDVPLETLTLSWKPDNPESANAPEM